MESLTCFNESAFKFKYELWVTDFSICSILTVVSLYLSVALISHRIHIDGSKRQFLQFFLERRFDALSKCISTLIAIASLVGNTFCTARLILERITISYNAIWPQNFTKIFCGLGQKLLILGYCICCFLVILFLWIRQRIFYVDSPMGKMDSTLAKRFSIVVLIMYNLIGISVIIVFLASVQYRYIAVTGTCALKINNHLQFAVLVSIWTLVTFLMQIALLGLFIYPICQTNSLQKQKQNKNLLKLRKKVIKAAILASICTVSDCLFGIVLYSLHDENTTTLSFPFSINLFINLSVTIACFDCWKKLIWPWSKETCKITISAAAKPCRLAFIATATFSLPDQHTSIKEIGSDA